MVNSRSNYKEILILETLKKLKKFQNIIGVNTAVVIFFFKCLHWSCGKFPTTYMLCFSVDKGNNLIKMQMLSRKETADANSQ